MDAFNKCKDKCSSLVGIEVGEAADKHSIWKCDDLVSTFKFWFTIYDNVRKQRILKQRSCDASHLRNRRRRQTGGNNIESADLSDVVEVERESAGQEKDEASGSEESFVFDTIGGTTGAHPCKSRR